MCFMNPPPRKCLMKFNCKTGCQNAYSPMPKKIEKEATKTCIIWDHDDVCRESPPIFIEISGEEPYWYDKVILVQKPSDS